MIRLPLARSSTMVTLGKAEPRSIEAVSIKKTRRIKPLASKNKRRSSVCESPMNLDHCLNICNKINDHFSQSIIPIDKNTESNKYQNPSQYKQILRNNHLERLTNGTIYTPRHLKQNIKRRDIIDKSRVNMIKDNAMDVLR